MLQSKLEINESVLKLFQSNMHVGEDRSLRILTSALIPDDPIPPNLVLTTPLSQSYLLAKS